MIEKVTIKDILRPILVPIHSEARVFVFIFATISLALFVLFKPLGVLGFVLTIWCVYFFRDPPRQTPQAEGLVISPADGIIQNISDMPPPPELTSQLERDLGSMRRISIFMNVFDVHINRLPISGTITALAYKRGKFFSADMDKASEANERQSFVIQDSKDWHIVVVQIAGLIARRIVCRLKKGTQAEAGQRFGLIRFGSRVDVYVPRGFDILCAEGQSMLGGETVLARAPQKSRKNNNSEGETRGSQIQATEKAYIEGYD